ncbi:MAG: hypothetical protein KIT87_02370 [Anaerolineae bacterium]|nr:hypothetical protein [Anaerolineae bacterium]
MSDIDFLVDRLEKLVQDSSRLPLTDKLMVDEEAILRLVDQLRTTIPAQIRDAQRLLQERDALIAQGEEKAAGIVKLAQERADQMVGEQTVLQRVEQERQAIIEAAEAEAARIRAKAADDAEHTRSSADAYALDVLRDLERNLANYQRTLANGIALLKRGGEERRKGGEGIGNKE